MAHYESVTAVKINHYYFADGNGRDLVFTPTAETVQLLQRHQLLVKQTDGHISVLADQDVTFSLTENMVLQFEVFTHDTHFASYTEMMEGQRLPLYYSTASAMDNNIVLQAMNFPVPDVPAKRTSLRKNVLRKAVIIIDVHITPADFTRVPVSRREYSIQLNSRAFYWKYYFFGDLAHLDLAIHDLNSQSPVSFEFCDEPIAKNGKAFISHMPIVMNNVPSQRFQLKEKNTLGKILIKRLPNAGIHLIGKGRRSNGETVLVAEIYINQ